MAVAPGGEGPRLPRLTTVKIEAETLRRFELDSVDGLQDLALESEHLEEIRLRGPFPSLTQLSMRGAVFAQASVLTFFALDESLIDRCHSLALLTAAQRTPFHIAAAAAGRFVHFEPQAVRRGAPEARVQGAAGRALIRHELLDQEALLRERRYLTGKWQELKVSHRGMFERFFPHDPAEAAAVLDTEILGPLIERIEGQTGSARDAFFYDRAARGMRLLRGDSRVPTYRAIGYTSDQYRPFYRTWGPDQGYENMPNTSQLAVFAYRLLLAKMADDPTSFVTGWLAEWSERDIRKFHRAFPAFSNVDNLGSILGSSRGKLLVRVIGDYLSGVPEPDGADVVVGSAARSYVAVLSRLQAAWSEYQRSQPLADRMHAYEQRLLAGSSTEFIKAFYRYLEPFFMTMRGHNRDLFAARLSVPDSPACADGMYLQFLMEIVAILDAEGWEPMSSGVHVSHCASD